MMPQLELRLWGVRGTFPSPGADKVRHGGHTICSSVAVSPSELLVIDAGTGIKELGDWLAETRGTGDDAPATSDAGKDPRRTGRLRVHLLLTHFHLDHVMGLPFFAPLYSPGLDLIVHAAAAPQMTEDTLAGLMGGRLYPVGLGETPCRKEFRRFKDGLTVGDIRIASCPLRHPQGSVAYRLDRPGGGSLVLATDTENPDSGIDDRLAAFAHGADHLICDATFTPEEYLSHKGWGHSTWEAGVTLAAAAGVGTLHLGHLNPDHSDDLVDEWAAEARERFPNSAATVEGAVLEI